MIIYPDSIYWNIGGLFNLDDILFNFCEYCLAKEQIIPIHSVFGSVNCLFAGGRSKEDMYAYNLNIKNLNYIEEILKRYNSYGISCRYTFTSLDIFEDEFNETFSNDLLKLLEKYSLPNNPNGVIIALDSVNNYIKKNYPRLLRIASVTKVAEETHFKTDNSNYYNKLLNNYDLVVINTAVGIESDLKTLKEIKDLNRVEIIVNNECGINCPVAYLHYEAASKYNRFENDPNSYEFQEALEMYKKVYEFCPRGRKHPGPLLTCFDQKRILELYNLGIKNFKLQGREYDCEGYVNILKNYLDSEYDFDYNLLN